jgi:hypothetical protein
MSELTAERLERTLLFEQAITAQLDAIVKLANTTATKLAGNQKMEESQLRNLLNVAMESRSTEVVINFIRYQIARSENAWGIRSDDFGHTVIADIRGPIQELAKAAVAHEANKGDAFIRVMQLYLGYLTRAFYYGKKTGDFAKLTEVANAS